MSNIKINDVFQRIQYSATNGQTQFSIPFPFFSNPYIYVWQDGVQILQGAGAGQYGITGAGSPSGGQITLVTPATLASIITIEGIMPIDRTSIYSATISNLTGSDLNGDFNREVVMMKQIETTQALLQLQYAPWAVISQDQTVTKDRYIPLLPALGAWRMNAGATAIETFLTPDAPGLAPSDATYLLQVADSNLPNAQAMGALGSGLVVNTTTTGVQLIRSLAGVANETAITNANGIVGNPTVGIAANPTLPGTGYFKVPTGTTAQRPGSPTDGMVRYNTDDHALEVYENTFWDPLSGGVVDLVSGTANQIGVNNTDQANPIVYIVNNPIIPGVGGITLPSGTTAQRAGVLGTIRFNSQTLEFEGTTDGAIWNTFQTSAGTVLSVSGTANQVNSTGGANPILSLSATINAPGTFNIQSTTAINAIINDATMATAAATNISTSAAIKAYVLATVGTAVQSVSGTANQVNSSGGLNPVLSLSATINAPGTFNIQSTTAVSAIINDATMASASATNLSTSAAIKAYVDSAISGLNIQGSCVCATTTALTVTYANGASGVGATLTNAGAQAAIQLDGVSPTVGQRVLIKDQASTLQNGIYTVTTVGSGATNWVLTRATDYDAPSEVAPGDLVVLTGGTTQNNSSWLETATVTTIGTDPIVFVQFTASLPMSVANGGTGRTTATAYAPIVGGTTTTSAFQSVPLGSSGALFQSAGVGSLPGFTTTTYPVTNAINTIMYASSANILDVVTPANNGVMVYSAGGVPSSSTTLPSALTIPLPRINGINDSNGNEIFTFASTASPINFFNVINSSIGVNPTFAATGDDTNVGMILLTKGTGQFNLNSANTTTPLLINSGTGLQHSTAFIFANTSASRSVTLPDATGTLLMTGQAINTVPSIAFSSTSGVIGTTTNDSAAVGSVGELISSVIANGSPVTFTSNTLKDLTSITLTAGDWDIWGNIYFKGTTVTLIDMGIGTTTATLPDDSLGTFIAPASSASGGSVSPQYRVSISGSTTYYMVGLVIGTGTLTGRGGIYARRRR